MIILSKKRFTIIILLAPFLFLLPDRLFAQGDLMIYPKRITFENSKRAQELSLMNNGKDTARYVISVVQIRMKEDGSFQNINEPDSGQRFADKNFRIFPRTVVLAPHEAQTVRVQLIKTNELTTGEYRSHIYFRAQEEQKPLGQASAEKKPTSIQISIVPVFGVSVPVIIKNGESTTKVEIIEKSVMLLKHQKPTLNIKFKRTGNMSAYGDISVDYTSPTGKQTRVGLIQGVAIYSPTNSRSFHIHLDDTKGIAYNKGKLHISYSEQPGNQTKFAESDLFLY